MKISRVFCDNYPLKRTHATPYTHKKHIHVRGETCRRNPHKAEDGNCTETDNKDRYDYNITPILNT